MPLGKSRAEGLGDLDVNVLNLVVIQLNRQRTSRNPHLGGSEKGGQVMQVLKIA